MPIELTMIMKSLKVLYHIDGNCNEKFVDGKVKCTSRKISPNNWESIRHAFAGQYGYLFIILFKKGFVRRHYQSEL